MPETSDPREPEDWAALLKENWSRLARSPSRDFFVASHPGWKDPEEWTHQAEFDTRMILHAIDADRLSAAHTLEIGCGVGRLTPHLLERVASYTGIDIAPDMVAEARRRLAGVDRARFFESDGLRVPDPARDRKYDLVLCLAVFIHCPVDVIQPLAEDAVSLLRPGGRLRFQLLADQEDPTGIETPPELVDETSKDVDQAAIPTELELLEQQYYMGHAFAYEEAKQLFGSLAGRLTLFRFDPDHMYGDLVK